MGALAWVELLDRRGHVRARHRIDSLPALIGRSYGCDVLVDDPWVSPIHVRIYRDLDGSFKVEDAGSENGLWLPDEERRVTLLPLGRGVTLRAGHTLFRLVPADLTVPPALAMHVAAPAGGGWEHYVNTVTPGIPGDSGSAFLDASGRALGILSTLGIALPQAGTNGVGDISRELTYMHAHGGPAADLVPGTEAFNGTQLPLGI
jgi:pSer/pThr/pTyr-binding forkhead associated (FHA) protein